MSEWISVKDRLPDKDVRVLAYSPAMADTDIGPFAVQWGWMVKMRTSGITHWMPLPELPEEVHP